MQRFVSLIGYMSIHWVQRQFIWVLPPLCCRTVAFLYGAVNVWVMRDRQCKVNTMLLCNFY